MPTIATPTRTALSDDHLHVLLDALSLAEGKSDMPRQCAASYDAGDATDPKANPEGWSALLTEAQEFLEDALSRSEPVTGGSYAAPGATGQRWAVTTLTHPGLHGWSEPCTECLDLVDAAITMAKVTGSTGATETLQKADGAEHSATVTRVLALRVR